MNPSSTSDIERRLLDERRRLGQKILRIEADFADPMDDDLSEQAVEREDDEALEGEEKIAATRLQAIDAALARLREGTYGFCIHCGEAIAPQRLIAMPEAVSCITCAGIA
jgi:RNA polymerase-binding transcription factor DksA